jgi:hypothetical protein
VCKRELEIVSETVPFVKSMGRGERELSYLQHHLSDDISMPLQGVILEKSLDFSIRQVRFYCEESGDQELSQILAISQLRGLISLDDREELVNQVVSQIAADPPLSIRRTRGGKIFSC